jgi:hypothetical protein
MPKNLTFLPQYAIVNIKKAWQKAEQKFHNTKQIKKYNQLLSQKYRCQLQIILF